MHSQDLCGRELPRRRLRAVLPRRRTQFEFGRDPGEVEIDAVDHAGVAHAPAQHEQLSQAVVLGGALCDRSTYLVCMYKNVMGAKGAGTNCALYNSISGLF